MAARIQGRVGEHGDAYELYLIENNTGDVSTAATASRYASDIDVESQLVNLFIVNGDNATVRTYEIAHSTSHARMDRIRLLVDAMVDGKQIAGLFLQAQANRHLNDPLPVDAYFNCPHGADRSTSAAEGAFFFIPENDPGQIFLT